MIDIEDVRALDGRQLGRQIQVHAADEVDLATGVLAVGQTCLRMHGHHEVVHDDVGLGLGPQPPHEVGDHVDGCGAQLGEHGTVGDQEVGGEGGGQFVEAHGYDDSVRSRGRQRVDGAGVVAAVAHGDPAAGAGGCDLEQWLHWLDREVAEDVDVPQGQVELVQLARRTDGLAEGGLLVVGREQGREQGRGQPGGDRHRVNPSPRRR